MAANDPIGERIKLRRRELGLTLKALEGRAGVSATHVSEIERGRTSPTVSALAKISAALGKDIRYFLEREALEDLSLRRAHGGTARPLFPGARGEQLAGGVPGGQLSVHHIQLDANAAAPGLQLGSSSVIWLQRGRLEVEVAGEANLLEAGDSLHIGRDCPFHFGAPDADGAELWLMAGSRQVFA